MERTVCELFAGVGGFRCGLNAIHGPEDMRIGGARSMGGGHPTEGEHSVEGGHPTEGEHSVEVGHPMEGERSREEKWSTVWFNQWEPAEKNTQYAHDCYVYHFGTCLDKAGQDTTNVDIEEVDKSLIPDFNLLVGGFPCQDYSVASSLATSRGLEGKKGILWWSIRKVLEVKRPPFVLLENVDRLLKSPASQRGRDFGIMLACFRDAGYAVEWRVINAADYGLPQRRRRIFIFACREDTAYCARQERAAGYGRRAAGEARKVDVADGEAQKANVADREARKVDVVAEEVRKVDAADGETRKVDAADGEVRKANVADGEARKAGAAALISAAGFFAGTFPVGPVGAEQIKAQELPESLGELSASFRFGFENAGVMRDGMVYTAKTMPSYQGPQMTLGDIMEQGDVEENYFIPEERLYYTSPEITRSDETRESLSKEQRKTWQYLKGAKKLLREAASGHAYVFSEGAIPMVDEYDKPARTMLTSEGSFSRTTHIVKDKRTGRIRLLTAGETERIQGFPTDHTKYCLTEGKVVEMPLNKRRFMMGNALVVGLVERMGEALEAIFKDED